MVDYWAGGLPPQQSDAIEDHVFSCAACAARLEAIAKEKKCTPAQLVLAWVLAQGKDVVAIPGTKRKQRLDENLAALQVKLSREDIERVSAAAPVGAGAGERYPAENMKRVYL